MGRQVKTKIDHLILQLFRSYQRFRIRFHNPNKVYRSLNKKSMDAFWLAMLSDSKI